MDYYLKHIYPKEKKKLENEKQSDVLKFKKDIIKVIEDNNNFPKEMPRPIKLKDLLEYYGIKWRKNIQKKCNEKY